MYKHNALTSESAAEPGADRDRGGLKPQLGAETMVGWREPSQVPNVGKEKEDEEEEEVPRDGLPPKRKIKLALPDSKVTLADVGKRVDSLTGVITKMENNSRQAHFDMMVRLKSLEERAAQHYVARSPSRKSIRLAEDSPDEVKSRGGKVIRRKVSKASLQVEAAPANGEGSVEKKVGGASSEGQNGGLHA